jgi:hypothetical protein
MNNTKNTILNIVLLSFLTLAAVSCSNGEGFAPGIVITSGYQLAYGSSAADRTALANRIAGNAPPKFAEVISRWRRFSGTEYYANPDLIVATPAYCKTTLDLTTGMWSNSTSPVANPNTDANCNTPTMNSLSWIYLLGPDRLFNIQNTNNYNGFFSTLKFDNYIGTATVSSDDPDDDAIGVSVAVYFNSVTNQTHTLSAYRTQGGFPAPSQGWGVLYKVNGTVMATFGAKSVGGTFGSWSGRSSQIRIERTGNVFKAYCSAWVTGATAGPIDPASEIVIDVSDPVNNLTNFMGPQAYGYETISQARATFTNLTFQTPAEENPEYLYDLNLNLVYGKKAAGIGYELVPNTNALETLGYPKTITNIETQREFLINSPSSFTEL